VSSPTDRHGTGCRPLRKSHCRQTVFWCSRATGGTSDRGIGSAPIQLRKLLCPCVPRLHSQGSRLHRWRAATATRSRSPPSAPPFLLPVRAVEVARVTPAEVRVKPEQRRAT